MKHDVQKGLDAAFRLVAPFCASSSENWSYCAERFSERFAVPYVHDRLRLCGDGHVLYTWARPVSILTQMPSVADWQGTEGPLWIVDFMKMQRTPTRQAVRAMINDMLEAEIIAPGERFLFWRHHGDRYGHMRA